MFKVKNLTESFLASIRVSVKLGQKEQATYLWYKAQLGKLDTAAGEFPAAELRAEHLTAVDFSNAFVRAIKALYKWGCDEEVGLLSKDPFRKLKAPPCGERQRVLSRRELGCLYLASQRPFRRFLFVLGRTLARPGEIRALRWGDIKWDRRLVTLTKFKGKKRRRDGVKLRTIPLDLPCLRMLRNLWERRGRPADDVPVWIGRKGEPWSPNAVRCLMRVARIRAGLDAEGIEERVVLYTLRHTGATNATRAGVSDNTLARVMGHAKTATTNRYQHLAGDDLVNAIDRVAARPKPRPTSSA